MTPEPPPVDPLWVTLLPSFGSALLFVAAMVTLIVTINSTNKRAKDDREAARDREFNTWRRDAIVRSATDAMNAALAANEYYPTLPRRIRDHRQITTAAVDTAMEPIADAAKVISASSQTLGVIGAHNASAYCLSLRAAVVHDDLRGHAVEIAKTTEAPQLVTERYEELREEINTRGNAFATAIREELRSVAPGLAQIPAATTK